MSRHKQFLQNVWHHTLDILFPPLCLHCSAYIGKEGGGKLLCTPCESSITIHATLFCPACHARLPENKAICHTNETPAYLLGAASEYQNKALQALIHALKYQKLQPAASLLGNILSSYIRNSNLEISNFVVVPIPLHPARERARGFNQATLLAETISAAYHIPLTHALIRIKNTEPQANMPDRAMRKKNMEGCFAHNPSASHALREKHILLVDDVTTSGATIKEAVRALRSEGARTIIALVAAKA